MIKKYLIEFDEQSKAVVAKVSVTTDLEHGDLQVMAERDMNLNEQLLQEAQDMFIKAQAFAKTMTFEKMR